MADNNKKNDGKKRNKIDTLRIKKALAVKAVKFNMDYKFKQLNIMAFAILDSIINNCALRNSAVLKPLIGATSGLKQDIVVHNNIDKLVAIVTDFFVKGVKHDNKDASVFFTVDACTNFNNNYSRKLACIVSNDCILDSGKDVPVRDVKWATKDTYKVLCNMPADYWQKALALQCAFLGLNLKDTQTLIKKNLSKDNKDCKIQDYSTKAFAVAKTAINQ